MFLTTIIPTVNRPTLSRAVYSVLNQDLAQDTFEIVIINDSGYPLPPMEWQTHAQVRIINTQKRERSTARNTGAAVAQGKYLHFLDDDDWMLPGAFQHFWELAQSTNASWLYGEYRMVDTDGTLLEESHPDENGNTSIRFIAGEWLPLQAMLIQTDKFFTVGGFAPLTMLLGGAEDLDLTRMLSLNNDIVGTPHPVTVIRIGQEGSTTNWSNLPEQQRQSRENFLDTSHAFHRLLDSVRSRPSRKNYWHGHLMWIYLTSTIWNLTHRRGFTAISRFLHAIVSLLAAGRHIVSGEFWRGATNPHVAAHGWFSSKS